MSFRSLGHELLERWRNVPAIGDPAQAEWDFRDVPTAELKAACVWEAARESTILTREHSILEVLPRSPAIDWLLELRGVFGGRLFFESDFLSGPWLPVSLRCRLWAHEQIECIVCAGYYCSLSHRQLQEPIEVYGPLYPDAVERRGREKATVYQAWLRAIGVGRLRKRGLTVTQIFELYKSVGIERHWERLDEVKRINRQLSVERVIKRDAAAVEGILMKLLPSVFALEQGRL